MSTSRRVPQQERGERRVAQVLEAAAVVFAEAGYDAATMTEIAERAKASIGAVYQYFPNKQALVVALRKQYGETMRERWTSLRDSLQNSSIEELANGYIGLMVEFYEEHPDYFVIMDAPIRYKKDEAARMRLRRNLAEAFQERKPSLSEQRAYRLANVAIQIAKSMSQLYGSADEKEREELVKEYKIALSSYLRAALSV